MDRAAFSHAIAAVIPQERVRRDAPLAPWTTFKVGGPADWLIDVHSADQLAAVMAAARASGVPVTMLGGGSNVLVADSGVRGAVIRLQMREIAEPSPGCVRADGGVTINGLVRWTVSRGLAGLEAWAGTPGTVGGAIHGNAHFSGSNISEKVTRVQVMSREGHPHVLSREEMAFAYDTSRLQRSGEVLIWAEFAVSPGEPETLRAHARESLAYRKRTQPLALSSAGCVFQNPDRDRDVVPEGIPWSAGALVDRAGLKGHRRGGARISETHANFVVNDGTATAADIHALIEAARAAVRDRFGVDLRDEVVYLGQFQDD
jgi:UDP-N-acetylmuramate dehydrogenase